VDESLARLQTDRLDLYLVHEPDPETPLDETLAALDDLVRAGKVLYVGASNIEAWRLARGLWISDVRRLARFEWVQNSYSLLDRTPERELFPLCGDTGVGFTAFSPLAGGWLSGKYRSAGSYPEGIAHDAAAGAVPAPGVGPRVRRAVGVRGRGRRPRRRHDSARHRLGAASSAGRRGHRRAAHAAHLDAALAALPVALSDADAERLGKLFRRWEDDVDLNRRQFIGAASGVAALAPLRRRRRGATPTIRSGCGATSTQSGTAST
jgi:hypothetical protein